MSKSILIVDGDDTLWKTQEIYSKAIHAFVSSASFLTRKTEQEALEAVEKSNIASVDKHGFGNALMFAHALREAAVALGADRTVQALGMILGTGVFHVVPRTFDDTVDFLIAARNRFRVVLYTMGNRDMQERRVDQTGLRSYLDEVIVVAEKNEEMFRHVFHARDIAGYIGDSLKRDIIPALACGVQAVHYNWTQPNYLDATVAPEGYIEAKTLTEALRLFTG